MTDKRVMKLCVVFIVMLLFTCACRSIEDININNDVVLCDLTSSDFVDGNHSRGSEYLAAFKTKTATLDGINIHFASNVFDEMESPSIAETIYEFYYSIYSLGVETIDEIDLYLVSATTTGGPVQLANKLYLTTDYIESGEYKAYLISVIYGLNSWWQCKALAELVSVPEEDVTIAADLDDYLEKFEDSYILSLHPCYFVHDFADDDTCNIANRAATALARFIIDEYGVDTFIHDGNNIAYRRAWLKSMGISADTAWLDTDGAKRMDTMRFSVTDDVPMVLSDEDFRLNINSTDWINTSDEVYFFLLEFCDGVEKLYRRFEEEAPRFYTNLKDDTDVTTVHFRNSNNPTTSVASMLKAEAIATDDADVFHEIVHTFMPRASGEEASWLCEGLVTYLTAPYVSYYMDSVVVDSITQDWEGDTQEDIFFRSEIVKYYELLNNCKISDILYEKQPIYKVYEASAYAAFANPKIKSTPAATEPIRSSYGLKGTYPGNELSYCQSMIFVDYLVEKYGLDTLIEAEMNRESYFALFPNAEVFNEEFSDFYENKLSKYGITKVK